MGRHVVENRGSEARDHLANERTFLAWFRTALGLVGLGVIVERLGVQGSRPAEIAGLVLIAFGSVTLVYAVGRYGQVARELEKGSFPIAKRGPFWLGVGATGMSLAALVYLLLGL